MKKSLLFIISAILIVNFTGCSRKLAAVHASKKHKNVFVIVGLASMSASLLSTKPHMESQAFKNTFQLAAETTIVKGYKYFAILIPKEISNTQGSLMNTPKELLDYCLPSLWNVIDVGVGLHKCGTYKGRAEIGIMLYNKQPINITVFNAQEVIDYYKDNDIYNEEIKEIAEEYRK